MQDIASTSALSAPDAAKLAALRRMKALATGMLVLCLIVFLLARSFEASVPALAFVAAFTEAAMIGGLADWYAVVALFRRPLGLPIPHTAIIPSNQERIADNLGHFIEQNFLAPDPVSRKLREVDFAALVADWLAEPERAQSLSRFVARLVPQAVTAIEGSGLREFVAQRVTEQIEKVQVAPLAAELLTAFADERRHQRLLDEIVKVLARFLNDQEALDALRDRIRDELPSLAKLFRADAYLLKKIVLAAGALLDEVKADPDHPMRAEFDRFVEGFVEKLRTSKAYAKRAETLKRDFLARPELRDLAQDMWQGFRTFLEQDARSETSMIRTHMASLFVDIGRQLAADPAIRADMNAGFVVALSSFVESQKSGVSRFIADQVKGWDLGQLTQLIEINVGRDLQFIRFNGMLVGGLAGLALHVGELLIFGN
ncbi:DUF445 domain-containing protein [Mesorhizobium australicum]|uniref:Uncharacterized membrane-anchored protein YjiN, DUF445 family n=1 Tax=Mesorhizobium australicum TaxID=536018 RepID=A0A1X7P9K4_9HYPH|nr:DUF445 family protein [Mesorhizobium australicum]SMH47144.1 Uncharacterized membrane-anchored protein YjiN, DUF445 family [Mesorhizobium australicum]